MTFGGMILPSIITIVKVFRTFEKYQWSEAERAVRTLIRERNILGEDDLLIMSHLDELLSRKSLVLAKHCEMRRSALYGAIIMPMGNLNFAFR